MRIIESQQLDKQQWDNWVEQSHASEFSNSYYLDAVADNWCVLMNEHQTGGIACSYTVKLGIKQLYAPYFHRYSEWMGEDCPTEHELIAQLKQLFPVANAHVFWKTPLNFNQRIFQSLEKGNLKINEQARRMVKKSAHFSVDNQLNTVKLLDLVTTELSPKIQTLNNLSIKRLTKLIHSTPSDSLIQLNLLENGEWKGGIWLIENSTTLLYLKGTTYEEAKKQGGMYRLMHEAIQLAHQKGLKFDFGGSNAEGVKRFNYNFGATDEIYYQLEWNTAPLWWRVLKWVNSKSFYFLSLR